MNMCLSKAVVEMLFCCECGLASWGVHPLKLTTKHILLSKYVLVVISHDFIMISNQNMGFFCGATKCENYVGSVK